jgi:2-polyprenyl-6-hydroxyphenyl methylase/3-demethylubiquinone-9 3-methyltransferase
MAKAARITAENDPTTTADGDDVARFSAIAEAWWDVNGDFRPLHKLNPTRLTFIRDHLCGHFGRDPVSDKPLANLGVMDIGCGGGLLSEPMRRLGATVTGIDASEKNIAVAQLHAEQSGLEIDYRHQLPEDLSAETGRYDVVLNMEVVEHVADLGRFLEVSAALVKPDGVMIVSTLNRTLKSLALAKVGAEYVLRWLPVGTHDWRKFVRPSELETGLRPHGLKIRDLKGMVYRPIADEWRLGRDLSVNYLAFAVKE